MIEIKDATLGKHWQIENCDVFTIKNQLSHSSLEICTNITEILIQPCKAPIKSTLAFETPSLICSIFPISPSKSEDIPKIPHRNLSLQTSSLHLISKSGQKPLNSNQDDQEKPKNVSINQEPLSRDPIKDFFILVFPI